MGSLGGESCGQLCAPVGQCLGSLGSCDAGGVLGSVGQGCSQVGEVMAPLCQQLLPLLQSLGGFLCQALEMCAACVPD